MFVLTSRALILMAVCTSILGLLRRLVKNPWNFVKTRVFIEIDPGARAFLTMYVRHALGTPHASLIAVVHAAQKLAVSLPFRFQRFEPYADVEYFSIALTCSAGWANLRLSLIFTVLLIISVIFSRVSCSIDRQSMSKVRSLFHPWKFLPTQ